MVKGKRWSLTYCELARHLVRLMPVLRLRDARFYATDPQRHRSALAADRNYRSPACFLSRELVHHPQNLTDGQIRQGLSAMVQLLEHYFADAEQRAVAPSSDAPSFT